MMIEYRREQQRLFAGTAWHRLVQIDGAIRIAWKRVDLVNCDAPLDGHHAAVLISERGLVRFQE